MIAKQAKMNKYHAVAKALLGYMLVDDATDYL
jgi:hypothetical protein